MGAKHLTPSQIKEVKQLYKNGLKPLDIAKTSGFSAGTIYRILRRTRKPYKRRETAVETAKGADYWRAQYLKAVKMLLEHGLIDVELEGV